MLPRTCRSTAIPVRTPISSGSWDRSRLSRLSPAAAQQAAANNAIEQHEVTSGEASFRVPRPCFFRRFAANCIQGAAARSGGSPGLVKASADPPREENMSKRLWLLLAAAALIGGSASAQNTGMAALQAAAQKMGIANLKSIQYSGAGWQ